MNILAVGANRINQLISLPSQLQTADRKVVRLAFFSLAAIVSGATVCFKALQRRRIDPRENFEELVRLGRDTLVVRPKPLITNLTQAAVSDKLWQFLHYVGEDPKTQPFFPHKGMCLAYNLLHLYCFFVDRENCNKGISFFYDSKAESFDQRLERVRFLDFEEIENGNPDWKEMCESLCNDLFYLQKSQELSPYRSDLDMLKSISNRECIKALQAHPLFVSLFPENDRYYSLGQTLFNILQISQDSDKYLLFSNGNHAFGITYRNGWCEYRDSNKKPIHFRPTEEKCAWIAHHIGWNLYQHTPGAQTGAVVLSITLFAGPELTQDVVSGCRLSLMPFLIGVGDANNKHTPLTLAVSCNHKEMILPLLEEGASLDFPNRLGQSPLQVAAYIGNIEIATLLIERNADVNLPNFNKRRALHFAAERGNASMVQLLLEKGALVNLPGDKGITALHLAAIQSPCEALQALLKQDPAIDQIDNKGRTALQHAVTAQNIKGAKLLLERGANVNIPDAEGNTPLHSAVLTNNMEMVALLLESGSAINHQNSQKKAPLYMAAELLNCDMVKLLMKHGAFVHQKGEDDNTALVPAVLSFNLEIVKALLSAPFARALVNKVNTKGITPFHIATKFTSITGNTNIIEYLLKYGANIDLQTPNGVSSLSIALLSSESVLENEVPEYMEKLYKEQQARKTSLSQKQEAEPIADEFVEVKSVLAPSRKYAEQMVRWLVAHGANVNGTAESELSPLMCAVLTQNFGDIEFLIAQGADINASNKEGITALHLAASIHYIDVLRTLLKVDANLNQQDANGNTALHIAVEAQNIEAVKEFLAKKANVNLQDNKGETALYKAARKNNLALVNLLLGYGASPDLATTQDNTAFIPAAANRSFDMMLSLLRAGSKDKGALTLACMTEDLSFTQTVATLLGMQDELSKELNTAIQSKDTNKIRSYIDMGVKIDEMALVAGIRTGEIAIVQMLIDAGGIVTRDIANLFKSGSGCPTSEEIHGLLRITHENQHASAKEMLS